jgi:hypothetical protein
LSTDAGTTPAAGDGQPAPEPAPHRGLRDRPLGKLLALALVLVAAAFVARTCGSNNREITQEQAIEIATREASFEPCPQPTCVQIRYVPRGIPVQGYWGVVLADELGADGRPNRTQSFLVSVETGEITTP